MRLHGSTRPAYTRGAALYVCLILLLVLSLIAVSSVSNSILQERMSGNFRDDELADYAATSAMNEAVSHIVELAAQSGGVRVCEYLRCFRRQAGLSAAEVMRTPAAQAFLIAFRLDLSKLDGEEVSARLAAPPVYLIEDVDATTVPATSSLPSAQPPTWRTFRITARGFGADLRYDKTIERTIAVTL